MQTQPCLHEISVKIYPKQALWLCSRKESIQDRANLKCDYANQEVKSSDTVPERSTLEFHPHSSWHPRYQILHSNLGQKTELPIAVLQKTHIHLQQPLEREAEILERTTPAKVQSSLNRASS